MDGGTTRPGARAPGFVGSAALALLLYAVVGPLVAVGIASAVVGTYCLVRGVQARRIAHRVVLVSLGAVLVLWPLLLVLDVGLGSSVTTIF